MSTLDDDDRRYMEALFQPIRDDVDLLNNAVFGGDGRGGLTKEIAEARGFAKISSTILGIIVGAIGFLGINMGQR